jgi:predicted O-methyltransferase YrrM
MKHCRLPQLINRMLEAESLWKMGHGQDFALGDIGLGWTYYGLTRTLKPLTSLVIGSWRGFVPLILGQAIEDNDNGGRLVFIDPSLVDDHWRDNRAKAYFRDFGVECIEHHLMTSQQALQDPKITNLDIDLLFIDGLHTKEQCRLEFEGFFKQVTATGIALFHDSRSHILSTIYGKEHPYQHTVWSYLEELRQDQNLQLFDLPIAQGITLVQRRLPLGD